MIQGYQDAVDLLRDRKRSWRIRTRFCQTQPTCSLQRRHSRGVAHEGREFCALPLFFNEKKNAEGMSRALMVFRHEGGDRSWRVTSEL